MKEIILQIDKLLAALEVRGDSVIILADARKALIEAYNLAKEWENIRKEDGGPNNETS